MSFVNIITFFIDGFAFSTVFWRIGPENMLEDELTTDKLLAGVAGRGCQGREVG